MCRGGESALYLDIIMIIILIINSIIKVINKVIIKVINIMMMAPLWFGALPPLRLLCPIPLLLSLLLAVVRVQVLHHRRQSHLMIVIMITMVTKIMMIAMIVITMMMMIHSIACGTPGLQLELFQIVRFYS